MIRCTLDIGEREKENWVVAAIEIFKFLWLVNGLCVGPIGEGFIGDIGGIRCITVESKSTLCN